MCDLVEVLACKEVEGTRFTAPRCEALCICMQHARRVSKICMVSLMNWYVMILNGIGVGKGLRYHGIIHARYI